MDFLLIEFSSENDNFDISLFLSFGYRIFMILFVIL